MTTTDFGLVSAEISSTSLTKPKFAKTLITYRIKQAGKLFVFTQFTERPEQGDEQRRYFIGNRELTRDEVIANGEFPFDVD